MLFLLEPRGCYFRDPDKGKAMPERLVDDECELRALAIEDPTERTLEKSTIYTEEIVETSTGNVLVAHSGDRWVNCSSVLIIT